jgi:UDP-N-acetylmuramate--alanine ligase
VYHCNDKLFIKFKINPKRCFELEGQNLLELPDIRHIHFIGIGGISMSGLAEILLSLGYKVSGSDIRESSLTKKLEQLGAVVIPHHSKENIHNADLVVYTAAVKENNPELMEARNLNIPIIDRATLLGLIMKKYPCSIAVSGTHGKTTTTSMISMIMLESGLNPTIHVGGELDSIGGTTRIGNGRYLVAEACEYYESFLKFFPFVAVINNIEYDHADFFSSIEHVKQTFLKFASLVPKNGYVIANVDDLNVSSLLNDIHCNKVTYGLKSKEAMWTVKNIEFDSLGCASFKLMHNGKEIAEITMNVPGVHNVINALAASATCYTLGCSASAIKQGLNSFHGTHRRFELKGTINNVKVIDDYAHHPSEVKATLKAAKNSAHSKIWCVFQPHTYTRTKTLLAEFANAFTDADTVILADIYAAREVDNGEIHSRILADRINANSSSQKAVYINDFKNIVKYLEDNVSPGDLIITMGAGDIYKVGELYLNNGNSVMAVS